MLYNIPSSAVNALTPDLVDRLADIDNVVAIKESSADFNNFYKTLVVAGDRLHIFLGPASRYGVAATAVGSPGFIEAFPNYWGKGAVELFNAVKNGDMERANALQEKALALREVVEGIGRNLYVGVKGAMQVLGLPGGYPRLPLRPLGEPGLTQLREGLARLGLEADRAEAAE